MKVVSIGSSNRVFTNAIYTSIDKSCYKYVQIEDTIFKLNTQEEFLSDELGLNALHRLYLDLSINDEIQDYIFYKELPPSYPSPSVSFEVSMKTKNKLEITKETLVSLVKKSFNNLFLHKSISYVLDYLGTTLMFKCKKYTRIDENIKLSYIDPDITIFVFENTSSKYLIIEEPVEEVTSLSTILQPDFTFESIGVGGLDGDFIEDFRRTFATRLLPASVVREMGITNVKGMLLYGVPGCGKTRLARALANLIGSSFTKVVNGPECLDRYVGSSEQKIRDLFKDAEDDYKTNGDKAKLHVIIFDEIDAICKSRGSNPGSLTDSVVNQLLTKIDGVESVPNVFIIGMTNIPEVIDKALTRPGRLELKLEVGLPDLNGRIQILNIHTKQLKDTGRINNDININDIAKSTANYTGAELESVVKNAVSLAIINSQNENMNDIVISKNHFDMAICKVVPNFGIPENLLHKMIVNKSLLYDFSQQYQDDIIRYFKDTETNLSRRYFCMDQHNEYCLSDAANIAINSGVAHIRYLCAKQFLHIHGEQSKAAEINKILFEANKAPESIIIIDRIDKICEFIANGRSFSSIITHTLSTWITSNDYNTKHKMVFIITNTESNFLTDYINIDFYKDI